jgi:outer membrane protein assembly factor BamB
MMNLNKISMFCVSICLTAAFAAAAPYQGPKIENGAIYRASLTRSGVFNKTGVTGKPVTAWETKLGGEIKSSPVVYKGTLYVGSPTGFHALDAVTGNVKWTFPASGVESSACVTDGLVVFTTLDNRLVALNPADGTVKWEYKGQASDLPTRSSPAIVYGFVLSVVGREIVALDINSGKKIYAITENVPKEFHSVVCTPDEFYAGGPLNWGYCFAYDYATSKVKWQSNSFEGGTGVYLYKTPAVDTDGSIYFNYTRNLNKYNPAHQGAAPEGKRGRIWNCFLLDKQVDDNELIPHSSPTPYNGLVYAGRNDGKFAAVNAKDGSVKWMNKYGAACLSDPSVAASSGLVIFGCDDGQVRALDCKTGQEKWSFETGAPVFSSPWIEDGVVYVATENGTVYALRDQ